MAENKLFTTILKKELNDSEMSVVAWANKSDVIDRSGDLIDDNAWDLTNFMKNPVVPAFHMYNRPPVGRAMWAKVVPGQGLRFKVKFASTDEGKEFYQLYKDGVLNAFSVGFMPKDVMYQDEFQTEDVQKYMRNGQLPERVFKNVELFEISSVVVPDNMNALVERSVSGNIKTKGVQEFVEEMKKVNKMDDEKAKVVGFVDLEKKSEECSTVEDKDMTPGMNPGDMGGGNMPCDGGDGNMPCDGGDGEDRPCDGQNCPQYDACQKPNKKSLVEDVEEKGTGSSSLPTSDNGNWDGNAAVMHMREAAGGEDSMDWSKYGRGFAYIDTANKEKFGSYRLPFADVENGELKAVWGGVNAAMAAVNGARQNMTISTEDRQRAYNLLAGYYKKFDKEPPEFKKELEDEVAEEKDNENIGNLSVNIVLDEKFANIIDEVKNEIKEIRKYVDENIEEKLKFFYQNADKVNNEENLIDFEIKTEKIDLDFSPEDIKQMIRNSVTSAIEVKNIVEDIVDEKIKQHKGVIF